MRRVIVDSIISLDGYYTTLRNEIDWFGFNQEEVDWSKEILRRVDAMLYGQVTYQDFMEFWPRATPEATGFDAEIIGHLNGLHKVAFSRTLTEARWGPATLVRDDPAGSVARLKQGPAG